MAEAFDFCGVKGQLTFPPVNAQCYLRSVNLCDRSDCPVVNTFAGVGRVENQAVTFGKQQLAVVGRKFMIRAKLAAFLANGAKPCINI